MDNCTDSLLCEENLSGSPWTKEANSRFNDSAMAYNFSNHHYDYGRIVPCVLLKEDYDERVQICIQKELDFVPEPEYSAHLKSTELCDVRCRAVRWMIKACSHFSFNAPTVSSAVNYLDRFLSKNLWKAWKSWMIELASVGCLSIAAKMDEVYIPLLMDLQVEGVDHIFDSSTIQRMELTILKTLEWRLNAVTAFAYTEAMLQCLDLNSGITLSLNSRITELLLGSLPEVKFLEFRPSIVAVSALLCALEELVPLQAQMHMIEISKVVVIDKEELQRCYKSMEERVVDPLSPVISSSRIFGRDSKSPPSPVTVTEISEMGPLNGAEIFKYSLDFTAFKRAQTVALCPCTNAKKPKQDANYAPS